MPAPSLPPARPPEPGRRPADGLVQEVYAATRGLAGRLGAQIEDVADLIQEFWVACLDPQDPKAQLPEPGRGRAFLTRRLRWRLIDQRRRDAALRRAIETCDPRQPRSAAPRSLDELIRQEEARRLLRVVEQLPQAQQEVLRLVFFEDCSHAEAAAQLGTSENAVKQRIKRAVAQIRQQLYREGGAP